MEFVEIQEQTARELIHYASLQNLDLWPICTDWSFQSDNRWISFWRKVEKLSCTGRPDEADGTLHYNMQGTIRDLPTLLKDSGSAFRGVWSEAGVLDEIGAAFHLAIAWLLDEKEVDALPNRTIRRYSI